MGAEGDSSEARVSVGVGGGEEEQREEVVINIRCSNGTKFTVRTSLNSSISAFKAALAQNCDVPADQQRLIYKGRILKDDQTLESYGTLFLSLSKLRPFCYTNIWVLLLFDAIVIFCFFFWFKFLILTFIWWNIWA